MDETRTAQYWIDKGYHPTPHLRAFYTSQSRWLGSQYVLKQLWKSEYGYEDVWLLIPKEKDSNV